MDATPVPLFLYLLRFCGHLSSQFQLWSIWFRATLSEVRPWLKRHQLIITWLAERVPCLERHQLTMKWLVECLFEMKRATKLSATLNSEVLQWEMGNVGKPPEIHKWHLICKRHRIFSIFVTWFYNQFILFHDLFNQKYINTIHSLKGYIKQNVTQIMKRNTEFICF